MIVEILNCALWLLSVFLFWEKSAVYAITVCIVMSSLICIFFIDLEHMLIFDRFHFILIACGILAIFFDPLTDFGDHLIGGAAAGLLFLGIYYLAIWVLEKEGLGFGDVKLAFASGLLLGWQRMLLALLLGSISASIVLLTLRRRRGDDVDHEYPFGPFLAAAIAISLLFGGPIVSWYSSLIAI